MIQKSREIWHRDDFALLCNWRCLWRCVEIGVGRAEWSQTFLSRWMGQHNCGSYCGIDPFIPTKDFPFDREGEFIASAIRFERFANVASLIRTTSNKFLGTVAPGTIDFGYIDGSHEYPEVSLDICMLWPLLSDKGIMAGHDFDSTHRGVIRAVEEFAERECAEIYLTTRDGPLFSWYAYKSGMPGQHWRRNED